MSQEGAQPGLGLPPGQVATLTVVRGPDTGLRLELSAARTVIGRRQGELVLSDREVSGVHAAIEAGGGLFVLRDLGSTNGCFVDGQKVSNHQLTPGCHLKCGATYLRFDIEQPEPAAPPAPPAADDEAPLIAAEALEPFESGDDLGLGDAPPPFDDDTPPPIGPPPVPPGVAAPAPPEPFDGVPEEIPTGVAPPSSLPSAPAQPSGAPLPPAAAPAPPAAAPIPPAGVVPPAGPASSPGDGGPFDPEPERQEEPLTPDEPAPPRVGVTSHGEKAESGPSGTPWDALSLPAAPNAPIPPSPGAGPHVQTPLPGSIQVPPPEPSAPAPPPAAAAPVPPAPPSGPAGFSADAVTPPPMPAAAPPASLPADVAPSPHDLYLVVEAGADQGQVFPITKELTVLGRSDLGVQIRDPDVSRKHVALELQAAGGPHLLRDLGSTNGTLLNGVKVTENLIAPNDIIRMGVTRLKLVSGARALCEELARVRAG